MHAYEVKVERDGKFWLISVPEIGQVTQARFPGEIELMARDLIAIWLEITPDSFAIELRIIDAPEA